jgi:pyruvate formate lyase activating enzyme
LVLTTYGRSTGFCVDPIEKKPLYHFMPGSSTLSFGTAGCNLTCKFCQNWQMSKSRKMAALSESATPEQIAVSAQRLGCQSVSFTYNDPVIFHEYAVDVAQACHERGIRTVAVTAGYITPEPRIEFFNHMDAANVDLKAFSEAFYRRMASGHLQPILDTLVYLKQETQVWLEMTTLLIPGENDSPAELDALTRWVMDQLGPDVPLHFSAFHPAYRVLDKPRTPFATLQQARQIAKRNGLRHVFTGNVSDREGGGTYCHHCGRCIMDRAGWNMVAWHLTRDGACAFCGTPCAGVFSGPPGQWGARRLPVHIGG